MANVRYTIFNRKTLCFDTYLIPDSFLLERGLGYGTSRITVEQISTFAELKKKCKLPDLVPHMPTLMF